MTLTTTKELVMLATNDNTFGIEIETMVPTAQMTENGWIVGAYHVGAEIPGNVGWKTMRDGSIQSCGYDYTPVEIVSPVLRGVEGLQNVETMVNKLNTMGAKVNSSTGFHVHIGWNGSAKQLARLIALVSYHEKALYASTGTKSREHNQYCGSIKMRLKPVERMTSMHQLRSVNPTRYASLNLNNLVTGTRPTVEFRVFAGTLNIIKIKAYIQLCLGLVQKAMTAKKRSEWDMVTTRHYDGSFAMKALLRTLGWSCFRMASPKHLTTGLLVPSQRDTMKKIMMRMAKKYDAAV